MSYYKSNRPAVNLFKSLPQPLSPFGVAGSPTLGRDPTSSDRIGS